MMRIFLSLHHSSGTVHIITCASQRSQKCVMDSKQQRTLSGSPIRIRICFLPKSLPNTLERVSPILAGGKKSETGQSCTVGPQPDDDCRRFGAVGRPSSQRRPFSKVFKRKPSKTPTQWQFDPIEGNLLPEEKPHITWNHFQPEFCQIAFQPPPPLKQGDALALLNKIFSEYSDFDFRN